MRFILFRLGAIPKPGAAVDEGGLRFTVTEMERNRIVKVLVEKRVEPGVEEAS